MTIATIDTHIRLKLQDFTKEQINIIKYKYAYRISNTEIDILFKQTKDELLLPPSLSYFKTFLSKLPIEDKRINPQLKDKIKLIDDFKLRDHQKILEKKLEEVDHEAVVTMGTGGGKTASSFYFASKLNTYTLIVCSQIDHIQSFVKDGNKFLKDPKQMQVITKDWNKELSPIMLVTTKLLSLNPKFVEYLSNNVGLLIADEIHRSVTSEKTREEVLYNIKPKYRLYLSGTPYHRYDGFVNRSLSNNLITVEFEQVHKRYFPIKLDVGAFEIYSKKNFHKYKNAIYGTSLPFVATLCLEVTQHSTRSILIHLDSDTAMKSLKNRLLSLGVTAEILKATTPKNEREEIKRKYENGEIRVLIGGVVLEASLSLYRASVGINMTLSTSSNSSTQFLGRLDRYDASIDNHEKIFIDLVYGHKNYSAFLKRWESFKNLNLKKPKKFFEAKGFDILSAFKDIDFKAYLNKKQE